MEFDELQQIWDTQNNAPLYAIDEKALHNRILSKMTQGRHITNISELLLIIVNIAAGSILLWINGFKAGSNIFFYVTAAWMYATALYLLMSRRKRIKDNLRFERSMHGDLGHAISLATYQVHLSQLMRWNMLPVGALILASAMGGGKAVLVFGVLAVSFSLAWYAGNAEHSIYTARKRELETLQQKLASKN